MSWETKVDYTNLAIANKLICKSSNMGRSGQYLEKTGAHGNIAATKAFGIVDSPTNDFTIAKPCTLTGVKLGDVKTVDSKKYMLESFHYERTAGAEPTFNSTCKQVEDDAETESYFEVPDIELSPDEIAELPTSIATLGGTNCEFTKVAWDVMCTVGTSDINGYPVASDVSLGKIEISLTIGQYGTAVPTITPATNSGWEVSSPLTTSDPDSDMPEWTCKLTKVLTKTIPEPDDE